MFHWKIAPIDIHWCIRNVYGDRTLGMNTVRLWVMRFNSRDNDMNDKLFSTNFLTPRNQKYLNQFIRTHRLMKYGRLEQHFPDNAIIAAGEKWSSPSAGEHFYESGMKELVYCWHNINRLECWLYTKIVFYSWKLARSSNIIMLPESIVENI